MTVLYKNVFHKPASKYLLHHVIQDDEFGQIVPHDDICFGQIKVKFSFGEKAFNFLKNVVVNLGHFGGNAIKNSVKFGAEELLSVLYHFNN